MADVNRLTNIKDQNKVLLKRLQDDGWSPATLGKALNIDDKIANKSPTALDVDPDYHFWLAFKVLD